MDMMIGKVGDDKGFINGMGWGSKRKGIISL
jgi:hypothetical protein